MSGDDDGSWHYRQPAILAAGVAGLLLLALLVSAVIHTANQASPPHASADFAPASSPTSSTYTTESTSSTTYVVASVQTSDDNSVVTEAPVSTPDSADNSAITTTETTVDPYPTTTPTNAGHI